MAIRLHAVDCPDCENTGRIRVNVTKDPTTGTWDYDEATCITCAGTGQLPAVENYETFTSARADAAVVAVPVLLVLRGPAAASAGVG
jgi:hypothetical protein